MKITILGSGSSKGIPEAGNFWGETDPNNPRNRRTRSSLLLSFNYHNFLIDAGPDFREQMNKNNISKVDSVLFTHAHSDHIDGISDLLWMIGNQNNDIDMYASKATYEGIITRFGKLFDEKKGDRHISRAHWKIIEESDKIEVGGSMFTTFPVVHKWLEPTAIRYKNFCYVPDFNVLDERAYKNLDGLDLLIINANDGFDVQIGSSQSNFYQVIELNEKIKAKKVILSHVKKTVDHVRDEKKLPENFAIAYDGMILEI